MNQLLKDIIKISLKHAHLLSWFMSSAIGLAVLYNTWEIGNKWFTFSEWKLFVLVCGIPSLLCALVMMRMPESPRFLLLQGNHHKAKEVLVRMYVTNTKDHPDQFPVSFIHSIFYLLHSLIMPHAYLNKKRKISWLVLYHHTM